MSANAGHPVNTARAAARRRRGAATALLGLAAVAGCASPQPADTSATAAPDAEHVRSVLMGGETGLEVRQWLVIERADMVPAVLARHQDRAEDGGSPQVLPPEAAERLRRNGLRLVRVPAEALDSIAEELILALDRTGRHGQVLRWQELHATPVSEAPGHPRAVAIDGRVRVFDRGTFQLMSRSWIVQMEDGPYVQLELLPQFRAPEGPYGRLLGRQTSNVIAWPSMGVDLLLETGFAYILLSESPTVEWTSQHVSKSTDQQDSGLRTQNSEHARTAVGPEAPAPTTIGELMLSTEGTRRSRGLLVFVPRIAEEFFPPEPPGAEDRARDPAELETRSPARLRPRSARR